MFHFPCSTTLITIFKETESKNLPFFLDLHNSYQFRIKTQLYYNSYPDFDWDNKNEEIKINYPPLIEKIKFLEKDNYSLQVIDITNDPNDDNYGEYYYSKMLKIF